MKGSQGITTDVNIYFINYEMIKTRMIKTNCWQNLNQNRFCLMNAYQLPYLSLLRCCIILRCVRFFLSFSLNYQQGVTRCCICIDKWEDYQVYRQIKSKPMDTFGSGKSLPFERVDFSLYHFLSSFSKPK